MFIISFIGCKIALGVREAHFWYVCVMLTGSIHWREQTHCWDLWQNLRSWVSRQNKRDKKKESSKGLIFPYFFYFQADHKMNCSYVKICLTCWSLETCTIRYCNLHNIKEANTEKLSEHSLNNSLVSQLYSICFK